MSERFNKLSKIATLIKTKLYISLLLSLTINTVAIADDDSLNTTQDEVMVVLGKVPRTISDVMGSASVITSKSIEKELVHDIADLVRYQAGINIENSGTRFGSSGFSIRGLGGNRVATEIDGIPVANQFDIGSYSNSGRNFIDTDMIQQVEILRGPASSVYGSNAIGGIVSYITKKPIELLSQTSNDYYLGLKTGYYSIDNSRLVSARTAFGNETSSALLLISTREGEELENQAVTGAGLDTQDNESTSILFKYHYALSVNQELSFVYDSFVRDSETDIQSFIGQGRFRSTTALTGDDQSKRTKFALNYNFTAGSDWLEGGVVRLYNQKSEVVQKTDETRFSRGVNYFYDRDFFYDQDINGLRMNFYAYQSTASTSHTIGYGLETSKTTVTERRDGQQTNLDTGSVTNTILTEQFPVRDFPISDIDEFGLYINDAIKILDSSWSIIPAIRYDRYKLSPQPDVIYLEDNTATEVVSISETSISPKLGAEYTIDDSSEFYLQYVRGFRAPPFEDANIGLDIPLFNIRAIPNPNLKSETSSGYELGYNVKSDTDQFSAAAFYTDYNDFILTKVNLGIDATSGRILFQSQNVESAKIYGAEFSYQHQSGEWITEGDTMTLYGHLYWSKGLNKDTSEPLNSIEPNHALIGIQWLGTEDLSMSLNTSIYAAKKDVDEPIDPNQTLFKTSGYAVIDFMTNYTINPQMRLSFAINNLTDRKYWQWSSVNGMLEGDPIIESLSSAGINASIQLNMHW